MHRNLVTCVLGVSVLALAACNKAGEPGKEPAPVAGPSPTPAAGLWEQTMGDIPGIGSMTMQICLDAATASSAGYGSMDMPSQCTQSPPTRAADGSISFTTTCNNGTGGTTTSSGKVTGDITNDYTVAVTSETTGASDPSLNRSMTMSIHAVRKGDCPAGMEPGKPTPVNMPGMPGVPGMPAGMKMPNVPGMPK